MQNSRNFSRTSSRLSYCFQGQQILKYTDLLIKILLWICKTEIKKILVLENQYIMVVPLFGEAFAAPNNDTAILSINSVKSYSKKVKFKDFSRL